MMNNRLIAPLCSMALVAILAGTASATVLNFAKTEAGVVPGNNLDITVPYGSNTGPGNIIGATEGNGWTPNIAVAFQPTGGGDINFIPNGNVLEFHSATTFVSAPPAGGPPNPGPGFTVPVLQLDWDATGHENGLPPAPTIDFVPDAGFAVKIHELKIGNANDQVAGETPYPWIISVLELLSLTVVDSYTTAALGAGNSEIATFNYTGQVGVSYRLLFDSVPSDAFRNPRTAIDDVHFSQCVPEPSTLALVALCGLGIVAGRKRRS